MLPLTKKVQYIDDPDKLVLTPTLRRDLVKGWINKMVTRTKESSTATTWAAPILLMIILSYVVYNGQTTSSNIERMQTDITILKTQKEEQDKVIEKEKQEKFQLTREQEAYRNRMEKEVLELRLVIQGRMPKNMIGSNN